MKMNAPTELYENHHQKQMLLDNKVKATITPTTAMRMNGIKSHMTTDTTTTTTTNTKQDEGERKNQNRNLAKINWWNTPFKPLTIETIVDQHQQSQLQQQDQEQQISNLNKDESTSVYLLEQEPDQQQEQQLENENFNERKEEQDSLMSNGKLA